MFSKDQNIEYIADFIEESKRWLTLKTQSSRMRLIDIIVRLVTALAVVFVVGIFAVLILIYLSFAIAYTIDDWVGGLAVGFFIVSAVYLAILLLILAKKHAWVEKPMVKFMVSLLMSDMNDEDDIEVIETAETKDETEV